MLFKNTVKNISQTVAGYDLRCKKRKIYYPKSIRHVVNICKDGGNDHRVCQYGEKRRQQKVIFAQFAGQYRGDKGGKRAEDNIPYNGVCQKV